MPIGWQPLQGTLDKIIGTHGNQLKLTSCQSKEIGLQNWHVCTADSQNGDSLGLQLCASSRNAALHAAHSRLESSMP